MHIIDRRLNPGGKSLVNRQRFLRRTRLAVRDAVRDSLHDRSLKELDREGQISIPRAGIREPTLHRAPRGGDRQRVLPGNKDFLEGDTIPRPPNGGTSGSKGGSGDSEDEFQFVLTREEFIELFLDDLELPDLAKRKLTGEDAAGLRRAGYTTVGSPANLSVPRTMQKALSRRLALRRPARLEVQAIEDEIARLETLDLLGATDAARLTELRREREALVRRRALVAYLDPVDLRYRRMEVVPRPVAQAVMFCLMDVSGSMTMHMKDLAKRFFALLHLFLSRSYEHVDIVFIHHTDRASEVDEQTFFYSTVSGGTLVSSALEELLKVVAARYRTEDWNIYVAQASDGDNQSRDNQRTVELMSDAVLPIAQYVAYIEVGPEDPPIPISLSELWKAYQKLAIDHRHFAMRKVNHRREIYPVFRELFQKSATAQRASL